MKFKIYIKILNPENPKKMINSTVELSIYDLHISKNEWDCLDEIDRDLLIMETLDDKGLVYNYIRYEKIKSIKKL